MVVHVVASNYLTILLPHRHVIFLDLGMMTMMMALAPMAIIAIRIPFSRMVVLLEKTFLLLFESL